MKAKETPWQEDKHRRHHLAPYTQIWGKAWLILADQPFQKARPMGAKRHLCKGGKDAPNY